MSKKNVHPIISGAGWIGSFSGALVEELDAMGVSFEDIHKLGKPTEGRTFVRVCAEKIAEIVKGVQSEFLNLISGAERLILDATDGKEILADASDVFIYCDPDFRNWKADEQGQATDKTPVAVYEIIKDATYVQMFGSLNSDLEKLCLTQAQIKGFVKKHRKWLRADGYATLFPFKSYGQFFIADVDLHSNGRLHVFVYRFEGAYVCYAGYRHRVVVSQLA